MANTSEPFRRPESLSNSWNDLLQRINDAFADPPVGCEDVRPAPLELPEDCHRWSADDINMVQEAMEQTCPDISFTRVEPCAKWLKSYIDDIEAEIDNIYCDCEMDDECILPCSNATNDIEEISLGTRQSMGCTEFSDSPDPMPEPFIANANAYRAAIAEMNNAHAFACAFPDIEVEISREIENLRSTLESAEEARDMACAADDMGQVNTATCDAAEDAVTEARDNLEGLEQTLEELRQRAIDDEARADALQASLDSFSVPSISLFPTRMNEIPLPPPTGGDPWVDTECENGTRCTGTFRDRCKAFFVIQRRTIFAQRTGRNSDGSEFIIPIIDGPQGEEFWRTIASGEFSPGGLPVVLNFGPLSLQGRFSCFSSDCNQGGCSLSLAIVEYRQLVFFPFEDDTIISCEGCICLGEEPTDVCPFDT